MYIRFSFINFLNWIAYSVDVRVYPGLRALTFKICVGFMAILVGLSAVFLSIGVSATAYERIGEMAVIYDKYFPPARLSDGELIMEGESPVVYRGKIYQVVMDTSGQQWERDSEFPIAFFFLKDELVIDTEQTEAKAYSYSYFGEGDFTIDSETIHSARAAIAFVAFIFWVFIIFLDWSLRTVLMAMVGSFVVGIVAASFRILLPRNEQLKIAITAAVPTTILAVLEHLLLLREGIGLGVTPLPMSLFLLNLVVFAAFLVMGSRGYLLPYLPKDSE